MKRNIGGRSSFDMIKDMVLIDDEKAGKKDHVKDKQSGMKRKKKRPPQKTPLKYMMIGSGMTVVAFAVCMFAYREIPYIMVRLSGFIEDLSPVGGFAILMFVGIMMIMLADEISYLLTEDLDDDEEEFLFGIDDHDAPAYYTFYDSFEDPECDFGENRQKCELKVIRPDNANDKNEKNEDEDK